MFRSFNSPVKISRRVSSISSLLFSNSTPLLPQYDLPVTVSPSPAVFFSIFSLRSPPRSVYCQTRFASVMAGNSSNTVSSVHEFTVKVCIKTKQWSILFFYNFTWAVEIWLRNIDCCFQIWDFPLNQTIRRNISLELYNYMNIASSFIKKKDARGNELDLSSYKGKVLLIVNVASQW